MVGPRLAAVVPAYREAETIGRVVTEARRICDVIVIDDASPDDTGGIAAHAGAIVVRNPTNQGYDRTITRGFAEADRRGYTHVVTIDADGEHDPATLAEFCSILLDDHIPLVLGKRQRKQRISEVVMGLYVRLRFGVDDILCGMKGYDLALWRANGRSFDQDEGIGTELALNSLIRGVPFRQVPVCGRPRRDQPRFGHRFAANWRIMRALFRLVARERAVARRGAIHA